jgi:DegV family protein with EDD domain
MPAAAQPTPGDFMKVYSNLLRDHQSIISIHISTKLSGTINSARLAKEQFTGSDIELVDSELVHMACGFMVLKAANMASRGEDKEIILKSLAGLRKKIKALFVPKTLENLIKGGRMSKLKGAFASLLEVKPILTLNDGEIELLKKTRKWEQAKAELIKSMREIVIGDKDLTVSVGDADNHSDAEEIVAFIEKEFRPRKIIRTGIGIVVGSHLAPGGIAVTFYQE